MTDLSFLGLRDYLVIAAVLVGGYLLWSLLPLLRMVGKRRSEMPAPAVTELPATEETFTGAFAPLEEARYEPRTPLFTSPPVSVEDGREGVPGDFSRELAASSRDLEIRRLRHEMDQVLANMARLSEEVSSMRASRNVSPQYGEAMTLALQGETPDGIADRCGISVGEAELVAALARGKSGAEFEEPTGGRYADN